MDEKGRLGSNQSDFSHLIGRDFPKINFSVNFYYFKNLPPPLFKKRGEFFITFSSP
jgi:hypothetical protein